MTIPDSFEEWPAADQVQWLADELWLAAAHDEAPAPERFVDDVLAVILWARRRQAAERP